MATDFPRNFGPLTSPVPLSYLDDNFAQLQAASTSTVSLAGAALIGYMPSGSGSVEQSVQGWARNQLPTVMDYIPVNLHAGIIASTDSTDLAVYLERAFAAHVALRAPKGTYNFGSNIDTGVCRTLIGDGRDQTIFNCTDNTVDALTFPDGIDGIRIQGLRVSFTSKGTGDAIVLTNSNNDAVIDSVDVRNADIGFNHKNVAFLSTYNNCRATGCNTGFFAEGRTSGGSGAGTTFIYKQCYANSCNIGFNPVAINEVLFLQAAIDFASTNTTPTGIKTQLCASVHVKQLAIEGEVGADGYGVRAENSSLDILSLDGAKVALNATGVNWYLYSVGNTTGDTKVEVRNVSGVGGATNVKEYLMQNSAGGRIVLNKSNNDWSTISGTSVSSVAGDFIEKDYDLSPRTKLVELYDDFLGDLLADEWSSKVGTDPQCVAPVILADQVGGVVRMTTGDDGTAAGSGVQLDSALNWRANKQGLVFEANFAIGPLVTNVAVFIGLTDQNAALEMPIESAASGDTITTNATDAVGVMFDTAMSTDNWWLVGVANDVDATAQDAGFAPSAGTYATVRIEVNRAGTATFYWNGELIGTAMAGAVTATAQLTPVFYVKPRANGVQRHISVDFVRLQQNR